MPSSKNSHKSTPAPQKGQGGRPVLLTRDDRRIIIRLALFSASDCDGIVVAGIEGKVGASTVRDVVKSHLGPDYGRFMYSHDKKHPRGKETFDIGRRCLKDDESDLEAYIRQGADGGVVAPDLPDGPSPKRRREDYPAEGDELVGFNWVVGLHLCDAPRQNSIRADSQTRNKDRAHKNVARSTQKARLTPSVQRRVHSMRNFSRRVQCTRNLSQTKRRRSNPPSTSPMTEKLIRILVNLYPHLAANHGSSQVPEILYLAEDAGVEIANHPAFTLQDWHGTVDRFGNVPLHYVATRTSNILRSIRHLVTLVPAENRAECLGAQNQAKQTFLFGLEPEGLITDRDSPESFLCGLEEILEYIRKESPAFDFNHRDWDGQTFLHQVLYCDCNSKVRSQLQKPNVANRLQEICKNFRIDPSTMDNFGYDIKSFFPDNIEEGPPSSTWTAWIEQNGGMDFNKLLAKFHEQSTTDMGFSQYDRDGNTFLLAFIMPAGAASGEVDANVVKDVLHSILKRVDCVDMRNRRGETPLQLATRLGLPHVVWCLLKNGASIAVKDNRGTGLFSAARKAYHDRRYSSDEGAFWREIDMMLCVCLLSDVACGHKVDKESDLRFRPYHSPFRETNTRGYQGPTRSTKKHPKKKMFHIRDHPLYQREWRF
ncbi:hypothetical protein A1O3_08599 [Capronia epimyces CBS 606.96]|uniref:Uncharacterized protein n=1 Tax=Capronia epimyces CBS 606.96 TaxID=1182542 RepID=W9XFU0_9EURO|nr:uncharacterized protein A1O3_08599 [Capronia epimyces CBS 606.96]EXJ79098.1 hypothetical protein A1O3_08599 [Capronia epimyces CBS 606.96]